MINKLSLTLILSGGSLLALSLGWCGAPAQANQILQLYSPGGTQGDISSYSSSEESWVDIGTTGFQLWIAGDATGRMNGTDGILHNVTLVASYNTALASPLAGLTLGGAGNPLAFGYTNSWSGSFSTTGPSLDGQAVFDPHLPGNLSVGSAFNNHSVVTGVNPTATSAFAGGEGRTWISFDLGDMSDLTHCVADFVTSTACNSAD